MLEKQFGLSAHGTNVRTEVIAGITTFLTMAYIIFVNPEILSSTGMDRNAVFVATCLAAALGSAVMALWANWPIGMADSRMEMPIRCIIGTSAVQIVSSFT